MAGARVDIGPRLRERRRKLNLTLEEVARRAGLTTGFISEVERNRVSPSVASLLAICEVLAIRVGDLFESADAAIVRADQRRPISLGGSGITDVLLSPHASGRLQAVWSDLEPGGTTGAQPYSLPADEAFLIVIAGRVTMRVDGDTFDLDPGDALTYDPRKPHGFYNPSPDRPAQVLFVVTPPPF